MAVKIKIGRNKEFNSNHSVPAKILFLFLITISLSFLFNNFDNMTITGAVIGNDDINLEINIPIIYENETLIEEDNLEITVPIINENETIENLTEEIDNLTITGSVIGIQDISISGVINTSVANGEEVVYLNYKFSNRSNIIIMTEKSLSCNWNPDHLDNGWKTCEAVFQVENQNAIKPTISIPNINFSFFDNNITNQTILFSNTFTIVEDTFENSTFNGTERIDTSITFSRRDFTDFTALPSTLDTSQHFAIKISYLAPKYQTNNFNFNISRTGFQGFIDPEQSACGTLSVPGVYSLTQNVSSAGTCFTISKGNITLDCQGFNITYTTNGGNNEFGVTVTSAAKNVTVKNCIIYQGNPSSSSHGIQYSSSSFGLIYNNIVNITGPNSYMIHLIRSHSMNVSFNTLSSNGSGSYLLSETSNNSFIYGNNITSIGNSAYPLYLFGLSFTNSGYSHIVLKNKLFSQDSYSIYLSQVSNTTISDNNFTGGNDQINPSPVSILFPIVGNNLLISSNSLFQGISNFSLLYLTSPSDNITLLNNNFTSLSHFLIIQDVTAGDYKRLFIYNNSFADVRWLDNGTGSFQRNLTFNISNDLGFGHFRNLFIGNNTVSINVTAVTIGKSRFNSTTNITFFNLTYDGINHYDSINVIMYLHNYSDDGAFIRQNGIDCIANSICTKINYDSSNGTLIFNTTGLGSFSANGTVDIIPPDVKNITPGRDSSFTVGTSIEIGANVTDNNFLDRVLANLTYPNGSIQQLTLSNSTSNPQRFNISYTLHSSVTGNYNITFIANDTVNNVNSTEKTNFTVNAAASSASEQTSSSGSGSGKAGAGGVGGAIGDQPGQFAELFDKVTKDTVVSLDITETEGLNGIEFEVTEDLQYDWIEVKKVANAPEAFSGISYNTFSIKTGLIKDKLKEAKIHFNVPKIYLDQDKISQYDVALFHLEKGWKELPTKLTQDQDEDKFYYVATTNSFSYFLVGVKEMVEEKQIETEKLNQTETEQELTEEIIPEEAQPKANKLVSIGIIVILIIIVLALITNKRRMAGDPRKTNEITKRRKR